MKIDSNILKNFVRIFLNARVLTDFSTLLDRSVESMMILSIKSNIWLNLYIALLLCAILLWEQGENVCWSLLKLHFHLEKGKLKMTSSLTALRWQSLSKMGECSSCNYLCKWTSDAVGACEPPKRDWKGKFCQIWKSLPEWPYVFSVFQLWIPTSRFQAWISQRAKKLSTLCNISIKKYTCSDSISHWSAIAIASLSPVLPVWGKAGIWARASVVPKVSCFLGSCSHISQNRWCYEIHLEDSW